MEKHTHDQAGTANPASGTGAAAFSALLAKPCIFCDVREEKGFRIVLEVRLTACYRHNLVLTSSSIGPL